LHQRFDKGDGYKLVYVAISLDIILPTQADADLLAIIYKRYMAQGHKPIGAWKRDFKHAHYSNFERHPRNRHMGYTDRGCRITGELYCTHWDWQLGKADAIRAAGIRNLLDLGNLDVSEFWRGKLRLRFLDLDRFGRLLRPAGKRSRGPWIKNGENMDALAAEHFFHLIQTEDEPSIEGVVQECRKRRIKYYSALGMVDNSALIPPSSRLFMSKDSFNTTQSHEITEFKNQLPTTPTPSESDANTTGNQ
jgi:hypothetical protein